MTRVEELLEQVRALNPDEREELRARLDAEPGEDFELSPEWKAEIERRIEGWESGNSETLSWDEVKTRLRAQIDAAKG